MGGSWGNNEFVSHKIIRPSLVHSVSWNPINFLCRTEGQQGLTLHAEA